MTDRPKCRREGCTRKAWSGPDCFQHHQLLVSQGKAGYAPGDVVREHLRKLQALGWSSEAIAEAAGTSQGTPATILRTGQPNVRAVTAKALLSVPLVPWSSPRMSVSVLGTRRRLQALAWMGWTNREIAQRVGVAHQTLNTCMWRGSLSSELAIKVAAIYEELSHIQGPSTRAAAVARTRKYYPPAAWDDIDNDLAPVKSERSTHEADTTTVQLACEGLIAFEDLNRLERYEALKILAGRGLSDVAIAERLQANTSAVCRARIRHGIPAGVLARQAQPVRCPETVPDHLAVQRCIAGEIPLRELALAQRGEAVRTLAGQGWNDHQIAERLQASVSAVLATRKRNGIPPGVDVQKADSVKNLKRLGLYPYVDIFKEAA